MDQLGVRNIGSDLRNNGNCLGTRTFSRQWESLRISERLWESFGNVGVINRFVCQTDKGNHLEKHGLELFMEWEAFVDLCVISCGSSESLAGYLLNLNCQYLAVAVLSCSPMKLFQFNRNIKQKSLPKSWLICSKGYSNTSPFIMWLTYLVNLNKKWDFFLASR
jgi:hypothetical protein